MSQAKRPAVSLHREVSQATGETDVERKVTSLQPQPVRQLVGVEVETANLNTKNLNP